MIRISEETDVVLNSLQKSTGKTKQMLLEDAVHALKKKFFLEQINNAYKALREIPQAWQDEQVERSEWDVTLFDELENVDE